jgi:hypothetical protein
MQKFNTVVLWDLAVRRLLLRKNEQLHMTRITEFSASLQVTPHNFHFRQAAFQQS